MINKTLQVSLPRTQYPIYIGNDIYYDKNLLSKHIRDKQVLVVTNELIAKHYLEKLLDTLKGYQCDIVCLPDGENYKNQDSLNKIYHTLLSKNHRRNTTLIALGGGVIGDITGFAASTYQRGVDFIQIPTTLLAQVDASVGGKTAINHPLGKNMIGAFHQPKAVIADIETLITLPKREYISGFAEIIKYGLIFDRTFFEWIEKNTDALKHRDSEALTHAIHRSCEIKAHIVAQDEKENGLRAILNFGHTYGHALEAHTQYQQYLHGEAVAIGMMFSAKKSKLSTNDIARIRKLLEAFDLPTKDQTSIDILTPYMQRDKKAKCDGDIPFVLLEKIGAVDDSNTID
ncbi:MAG: 3-dehydroquinate synthase [Gammaproteobacteria bacterium]